MRKKGYYTADEIAEMYAVNKETVYRWMRRGLLKHRYISDFRWDEERNQYYGALCVTPEELDDFDPVTSAQGLGKLINNRDRKDAQDITDYLDRRIDELYSEICIIEETKRYLKSIEPYL